MDPLEIKKLLDDQQNYLNHFYREVDPVQAAHFVQACLACSGLIILSGVGKSGIIAQKIAMTLISTGTRALALPPTNFLHGDLGIVSEHDLLILISKSGETEELLHLIPAVKARGAKVLAMVSRANSRLEKRADLTLHLPVIRELCPFDLAPTISTTVQLNFGDVLAVALMQAKGFTLDQYALSHPAGSIGKKTQLRVEDLMIQGELLPLCQSESILGDILTEFSGKNLGCILVTNPDLTFLGIFTEGDLRRALQRYGKSVLEQKIEHLMTRSALTVQRNSLAWDAMKLMQQESRRISALPVVENEKLIGMIRLTDIIQTGI